ncbi:AAA family ATPase [soil metagenome]
MAVCRNCGTENPDVARFCMVCATPLGARPAPPQEARKTVTVVFCDLVGSTALGESLDSESLREVMDRYFDAMQAALERHGGIVEKFIGDAVMAVFGLPRAHEDDALRAVRAADEMRTGLQRLNDELERAWGVTLQNRIGVNTGEVVVGDAASGQRLATGDAVNVAARFEQAAERGSILIGEPTLRLVRDAVKVRAVEPLALKGKSERLAAFSLLEVRDMAEGIDPRLDAPLVGRDEELSRLLDEFDLAVRERQCRLVVVLGEAGLGKSRLVAEAVARLGSRARVLRGRCLSYGEGMTFWPVVEMVRAAAAIGDDDGAEGARNKLMALARDEAVVQRMAAAIGLSGGSFPVEDTFWAVRELLERLALRRPLAVVVEDIHWAEPTMLDLLAHVVSLARAPLLLLCPARRELLDDHPGWLGGLERVATVALEPLSTDEGAALVANLLGASGLGEAIAERIMRVAQGNPLYVEHILSMWVNEGILARAGDAWVLGKELPDLKIPPTVSALLAARLDRLEPEERAVVAGASVVGQVFEEAAVRELCPEDIVQQLPLHLASLTDKDFLHSDAGPPLDERSFAFSHILIRDAAYDGMLKKVRAELHERFGRWLEQRTRNRIGAYEEVLGYHLEQAWRYRTDLLAPNERTDALGRRAAAALTAAGRRALDRGDARAAVNLFGRASQVAQRDREVRLRLAPDLAIALMDAGELARAATILDEAGEDAVEADTVPNANIRLARLLLAWYAASMSPEEERAEVEAVLGLLESAGEERGVGRALHVVALRYFLEGYCEEAASAWRRAVAHAERAGDVRYASECTSWLLAAALHGPTPVDDGVALCHELMAAPDRPAESAILFHLGMFAAMKGDFDEARRLAAQAIAILESLGRALQAAAQVQYSGHIEMLAGEWGAAAAEFRRGYDPLVAMNSKGYASTVAGQLGQALCRLGHLEEAQAFAAVCRDTADADDLISHALWRCVDAEISSGRGNHEEAVRLAGEAVELTAGTDSIGLRADCGMTFGAALTAAGRRAEATAAVADAKILYGRKGDAVSEARAAELLQRLDR